MPPLPATSTRPLSGQLVSSAPSCLKMPPWPYRGTPADQAGLTGPIKAKCSSKHTHVCFVQILDLMGYEPSHWNKVNIHIGGVYGDKESTLERFAVGFQQLSDNVKKRLTLENDDWASAFSVKDLLPLSRKCNIPIVFDFHHHKFCSGERLQPLA